MLGTRKRERSERSASRDPVEKPETSAVTPPSKEKTKGKGAAMSGWTEPALSEKPSYRDNNGVGYGVNEFMQPLGEAPNAKVKARVKPDGARKSLMGKNAAGLGAQDTPEGTPAPSAPAGNTPQPPAAMDDDRDADYAPKPKAKPKSTRGMAMAPKSKWNTRTARGGTRHRGPTPEDPVLRKHPPVVEPIKNTNKKYDAYKLKQVVEAAKKRAHEVGKPDLAAAVNEIYIQSITDLRLTQLLECILTQTATKSQTAEFQGYVRIAKRKLRNEKVEAKESARKLPQSANGSHSSSLPLRSPSKFTGDEGEVPPLPSTEPSEPRPSSKPKLKVTSASKSPNRKRSSHGHKMEPSPAKKRSGSVGSDSSLTDMTSNADDTDVEEVDGPAPATSTRVNGTAGKDHAAERGSLAAPARGVKRSSADAEMRDDELHELAAKKQKLGEKVVRDNAWQESNMRTTPTRQSTLRAQQVRNGNLPPSLMLAPPTAPNVSTRGSRAVSADLDSPLSSAASSRRSTPQTLKPPKSFGKRAKTKQSPEKKHQTGYGGMSAGAGGAGRESPIGDDDNDELSENNDFCSACGGSGFLLCCDGCDRSFHFSCLDPPLNEDASELNEPWYCFICVAKRPVTSDPSDKTTRGLFAPLLSSLRKRNPTNFQLPQTLRDYFEGVTSDKNGAFMESVTTRTSRNRPGYDELPDFTRQKDGKGNTVLCYHCGKSSEGSRAIIQCDFCSEHWHLDCLDPPLANPPARGLDGKKIHDWMCPLHADHELRKMDTSLLAAPRTGRKVHMRRPRNAKVTETALQRGFRNNGVIDVLDDDSDSDSEFFEEEDQNQSVVYKLPASGIKLDFIDKVKSTRIQAMRNEHAYRRARIASQPPPRPLEQANFSRRSFQEKQLALNLAQFANANKDMGLGSDQVENLVGTLIAEAPSEVVDSITATETAESARSATSAVPPSPPPSEQPPAEALSAEQRSELLMLQALIQRRLQATGAGKT